uniref:Uncharacterized protein n=1 Tax=Aegilops tauschii TaxID=37682 RepID=R7WF97_AEGTA
MPGPGSQNGRATPPKSENIHGLVRAGDVAAVQRKLQENPALLNDKNPVGYEFLSGTKKAQLRWF